jgi:hypothetical protein
MPEFGRLARGRPACEMRTASSHRSARSRLPARPNASELCQSASLDRQSVFAISNNPLRLNTTPRFEAGSTTKFRVCMHRKAAALRFTTSSVGSSVPTGVPAESWLRVNVAVVVKSSRVESKSAGAKLPCCLQQHSSCAFSDSRAKHANGAFFGIRGLSTKRHSSLCSLAATACCDAVCTPGILRLSHHRPTLASTAPIHRHRHHHHHHHRHSHFGRSIPS